MMIWEDKPARPTEPAVSGLLVFAVMFLTTLALIGIAGGAR